MKKIDDVGSGYSIWIMPDTREGERYADIIRLLSSTYSTPLFEPHVTLLGGLSGSEDFLIKGTSEIASPIHSFTMRFDKIGYLEEYFRSLFVLLKIDAELEDIWKTASAKFHLRPDRYMPHMSLIYGFVPEEEKQEIIKKIKANDIGNGFLAKKLALYSTEGHVERWREIRSFDLS